MRQLKYTHCSVFPCGNHCGWRRKNVVLRVFCTDDGQSQTVLMVACGAAQVVHEITVINSYHLLRIHEFFSLRCSNWR